VGRDYGAHIIAIIQLADLIKYLEDKPELAEQLVAMKAYRTQYGI